VEGGRLVAWIEQRLRSRGMKPAPGVAALLAERVEGNMLAAAQEVEKLGLLHGPGDLDRDKLAGAISDSARYDLFDLTDAALAGDRSRVSRVLGGLAAEGTPPPLVLWALARELRMLASVSYAASQDGIVAALRAQGVWESRRALVQGALGRLSIGRLRRLVSRCADVDRQIKGLVPGDPWQALACIADELAGADWVCARADAAWDRSQI